MKILQNLKNAVKQALNIPVVSVSVASSEVGKCTTCRFNDKEWDRCVAGTYWAEKGLNVICYEGELWEATERCGDCDNYAEYDGGIKYCSVCGTKLS